MKWARILEEAFSRNEKLRILSPSDEAIHIFKREKKSIMGWSKPWPRNTTRSTPSRLGKKEWKLYLRISDFKETIQ